MVARTVVGFLIACAVAIVAVRTRSLARDGGAAAVVAGTICVAVGWSWAALLVVFFVTSSALSHLRATARTRTTESVVAKGGARDALQVLANGGLFALAAFLSLIVPWAGWMPFGAGALAAATADTWSTEIGTLSTSPPRLITSWRPVAAGTSGAVTPLGLAGAIAGSLLIALAAWLLRWPAEAAAAAVAGGIVGALIDSLLGALWQAKRHCPRCDVGTERAVHLCGSTTERAGGISWLDNDGVNFLSGAAGAVVALLVALR